LAPQICTVKVDNGHVTHDFPKCNKKLKSTNEKAVLKENINFILFYILVRFTKSDQLQTITFEVKTERAFIHLNTMG
jgi:hypothetical protein